MIVKESLKTPLLVIAAGAIGGLLGSLASYTLKQSFPAGLLTGFLAAPVLGGGAALIGVYLLANSDRGDLVRCLVFAMVCGIAWKPVMDAGSAIVTQHANVKLVEQKAETTRAAAAELDLLSESSDKAAIESKLQEATRVVEGSLSAARAADSPQASAALTRSLEDVLKAGAKLEQKALLSPAGKANLLRVEAAARMVRE